MSDDPSASLPTDATSIVVRKRQLLNGTDIRAARGGLRMSIQELADISGISSKTITRIESGRPAITSNLEAIRRVFEERGVFFQFDGTVFFSMKAEK